LCFRSIQAKEQTIIYDIRIVDSIEIHHDSCDHPAQLDQMMPVAAIACQSRSLNAKDSAHFAAAHFGHQMLESWALDKSRSRAPQIFVYHGDLLETQLAGTIHQPILATLAFLVMEHLVR
jgi:hypothetical protein